MSKWIQMLIAAVAITGLVGHAAAQDKGTLSEAKAMAEQAAAHVTKVGPEKAFQDFNDKSNSTWHKKDLYVFAYNTKGDCVAHGSNHELIGKNRSDMKDPSGKPVVQELLAAAKNGGGQVSYQWPNRLTKQVEAKTSFVVKLTNYDGLVGVGASPR